MVAELGGFLPFHLCPIETCARQGQRPSQMEGIWTGSRQVTAIVISFFSFYLRSSQVQRLAPHPILSPGCPAYHLSAPSDNHISSVKPLPLPSCLLSHFLHSSFIHSNVSRASTLHQPLERRGGAEDSKTWFLLPSGSSQFRERQRPTKNNYDPFR